MLSNRATHPETEQCLPDAQNPSATCEGFLEIRGLTCGYRRKKIVFDASFDMDAGEFMCIIGANGCGKTTLLKTILGLLPPMGGAAFLQGRDIAAMSDRDRAKEIAYIPQAHTPPFPFSVADVVLMGRTPHIGRFSSVAHEDKRIVWEALETLGIENLADRTYTKLSGGQRQLVLIARALAQQPKLIVMDEPTASLDFGNQQTVLSRMRELSSAGVSVLMVTHDPHHAIYCADSVVVIDAGHVVEKGSPEEVITKSRLEEVYSTPLDILDVTCSNGIHTRVCVPL